MTSVSRSSPETLIGDGRRLRETYLLLNDLTRRLNTAIDAAAGPGLWGNADIAALLLLQGGPLRPLDLAAGTGLSNAGVSKLVDRLEERRMVTRTNGLPGDRRAVVVRLTRSGHRRTRSILSGLWEAFDAAAPIRLAILELLGAERPDPGSLTRGSNAVIDRLARVGAEIVRVMTIDGSAPMSAPGHAAVAMVAASDGGVRPNELLELTGLSSGGVTLLVDRLEAAGLVERQKGQPPDRRAVLVTTTAAGERALEQCLVELDALSEAIAEAVA